MHPLEMFSTVAMQTNLAQHTWGSPRVGASTATRRPGVGLGRRSRRCPLADCRGRRVTKAPASRPLFSGRTRKFDSVTAQTTSTIQASGALRGVTSAGPEHLMTELPG